MKNPFKEIFYPDYQRKLIDSTTQELFEAKRAYLNMQQTEQYARAQKEYHALRVKTLSGTLELLKEANHEAIVNGSIASNTIPVPNGTLTLTQSRDAVLSK